jgi:hypothetical protein
MDLSRMYRLCAGPQTACAAVSNGFSEVFANPDDARALKKLYPGGVSEAKSAAERARPFWKTFDGAYFGTVGKSPQKLRARKSGAGAEIVRAGYGRISRWGPREYGCLKAWAAGHQDRDKAKSLADAAKANKPRRAPQQVARSESRTTILQGFASRK